MFGLKESHLSIPKVNKIDRRVIQGAKTEKQTKQRYYNEEFDPGSG